MHGRDESIDAWWSPSARQERVRRDTAVTVPIMGLTQGSCLHQSTAAKHQACEASHSRARARSSGDPILPRTSGKRCRETLWGLPNDGGIDLPQRLVGNTLQCFAEPDQQAFNCKLALVVGQVADFGVVRDKFQCFAAPRGVAARPLREMSEDTDEIATDAPPEFGQSAQPIVVVDVRGGAQDCAAQVSYAHQIED